MNRPSSSPNSGGTYWLYGLHAAAAALDNPERRVVRALFTRNSREKMILPDRIKKPEVVDPKEIDKLLPPRSVHQGVALQVYPLASLELSEVIGERPLLFLDQVTDPHNVGAILRSAAAFDAAAVVVTRHHAPKESGALAKAAAGALDLMPLVEIGNLAAGLREAKDAGYWVAGLDGEATQTMAEAKLSAKTALVLGSEGDGMRRLTTELCDFKVKLPIHSRMESLNVSNAAAIALYELSRA